MKILKAEFTHQECLDTLTNAIESGAIQYWAADYNPIKIKRDDDLNIIEAAFDAEDETGLRHSYVVTAETIQKGLDALLAGQTDVNDRIIGSILADNQDAETDDCIIQAALFGKLVYG